MSHRYRKIVEACQAVARRRITLYYQTQVSLQGTGSEPLAPGLDRVPLNIATRLLASLGSKGKNRNLLSCLPQKCRFLCRGQLLYTKKVTRFEHSALHYVSDKVCTWRHVDAICSARERVVPMSLTCFADLSSHAVSATYAPSIVRSGKVRSVCVRGRGGVQRLMECAYTRRRR